MAFFRKHVLVPNKPIWLEITLPFVQEKVFMGNNKGHKTTFPHTFCPAPQCLPGPSSPLPDSPLASWLFHHRRPPVSWSQIQPTVKSWVILNLGLAACPSNLSLSAHCSRLHNGFDRERQAINARFTFDSSHPRGQQPEPVNSTQSFRKTFRPVLRRNVV